MLRSIPPLFVIQYNRETKVSDYLKASFPSIGFVNGIGSVNPSNGHLEIVRGSVQLIAVKEPVKALNGLFDLRGQDLLSFCSVIIIQSNEEVRIVLPVIEEVGINIPIFHRTAEFIKFHICGRRQGDATNDDGGVAVDVVVNSIDRHSYALSCLFPKEDFKFY